ncbi:MAG: branched-chain amino acid ABC transporter permease [Alphaproteobacteria bacterium]|nr:branched-chain amino acid ABC transporter permease [Alphaproteobacteria bacterium]
MDVLLSGQLLIAALVTGSIYALVAVGLNLIYGTMRMLNVAHGDLAMIGAYVAFWLFTLYGISPFIALFLAVVVTAALAAVLYLFIFKRVMRSVKLLDRAEANSLLVFFGISVILQNGSAYVFTTNPRGFQYLDQVLQIGSAAITANRLVTLILSLLLVFAVVAFFRFTMVGLALRALIQNRTASQIVGINIERIFLYSFMLGFALSGLAGALVSMYEQIWPFMGFPYTIAAFVIIILGGLGNLFGSLAAGMILGVLETFGIAITGPNFRSILIYGVLILVLLLRPQGLFGGKRVVAR